MTPQTSRSHDRFAETRWSIVAHFAEGESPDARRALGELAQRYWYPVYSYVRRCGHAPDVAADIVRSFLQSLLRDAGHDAAPSRLYRRFLLDRLHAFLAADRRQGVAGEPAARDLDAPNDIEARYQRDHADPLSPDDTYQRAFALQVLHRAFRRLRNEAEQTEHVDMYVALEPYLAHEPGPGVYEQIGGRLGCRPLTLALALKRLRQRFREIVSEELADTVGSAEDLAAEQDALLAVLEQVQP